MDVITYPCDKSMCRFGEEMKHFVPIADDVWETPRNKLQWNFIENDTHLKKIRNITYKILAILYQPQYVMG